MKKRLLTIINAPWYFVLFAAYPVLAILAYNMSQVRYSAGIRPLIVSVGAATLLFLIFRLLYRDWHRAAFATAALTVLFYTYGHVVDLIQPKWKASPAWLGGAWIILMVLILVWAGWRKAHFRGAALTLNIVSLGLTVFAANQVISAIPSIVPSDTPSRPACTDTGSASPGWANPAGYLLYHPGFFRSIRFVKFKSAIR